MYSYIPRLVGFDPKFVIWTSDAAMALGASASRVPHATTAAASGAMRALVLLFTGCLSWLDRNGGQYLRDLIRLWRPPEWREAGGRHRMRIGRAGGRSADGAGGAVEAEAGGRRGVPGLRGL